MLASFFGDLLLLGSGFLYSRERPGLTGVSCASPSSSTRAPAFLPRPRAGVGVGIGAANALRRWLRSSFGGTACPSSSRNLMILTRCCLMASPVRCGAI